MPPEAIQMMLILGGLSGIVSLTAGVVAFRMAEADERHRQIAQAEPTHRPTARSPINKKPKA